MKINDMSPSLPRLFSLFRLLLILQPSYPVPLRLALLLLKVRLSLTSKMALVGQGPAQPFSSCNCTLADRVAILTSGLHVGAIPAVSNLFSMRQAFGVLLWYSSAGKVIPPVSLFCCNVLREGSSPGMQLLPNVVR